MGEINTTEAPEIGLGEAPAEPETESVLEPEQPEAPTVSGAGYTAEQINDPNSKAYDHLK